jgi:hypothetical protein
VPLEQGTVVGNPVTTRLEEKTQLVALVTCADKLTDPPEGLREEGVTANDDTVGFTGLTEVANAEADWGSR